MYVWKKNNFNFENARFLVKVVNRSIYKRYENLLMLISCVKLDHALYSINYGIVPDTLMHDTWR